MAYIPANTYFDNSTAIDSYNRDLNAAENVGQAPSSSTSKAEEEAEVNFDTFLKLLTVQLQNQDPLNPMDGTAFTEQIATFSALEQQIATNSYLEKIAGAQNFSEQTLAVSYIGKEALIPGNDLEMLDGAEKDFSYTLERAAFSTLVSIVDSVGQKVKTIEGTNFNGNNVVTWDGIGDDGEQAADGNYKIFVEALDAKGDSIANTVHTYGYVNAVEADGANIGLSFKDGRASSFDDVVAVRESKL